MRIDKILWATDGSEDSLGALKYVEILADKFKADVCALSVIPDYPRFIDTFPEEEREKFTDWMEETLKSRAEDRLKGVSNDLKNRGIKCTVRILKGKPEEVILNTADSQRADLISLGKGRTVERFMLGGTAFKVLQRSKVPVLTAGETAVRSNIQRILVPVDLTHGMSKSFEYADGISKKFGAELHLVNIVETGEFNFPDEMTERIRRLSARQMQETVGKMRIGENIETSVQVAVSAWKGIVNFAEENNIDLVVMMSYGGRKIKEESIGSVARRVIQEASCPVITLNP